MNFLENQPRSAYVHIPFCRHRCGYCNFTLVAGRDYLKERFLNALELEVSRVDGHHELRTLFLGGGTPSHLTPSELGKLQRILQSRFNWSDATEVTAECNPADLNMEQAKALEDFGVNRISLGVQSLNSRKLTQLERDHDAAVVRSAVDAARSFVNNLSLDLIFAAPGETLEEWKLDLANALTLEPEHISTYELTFEKGTSYWTRRKRGDLAEANEELRCDMYQHAMETLADHGFEHYEVSSFAKPNHRCHHNMTYWTGEPYYAFGPGSSSFVDGVRATNHQSTTRYMKLLEGGNHPRVDSEKLEHEAAARERLAIGLRLLDGIDVGDFQDATGMDPLVLLRPVLYQPIELLNVERGQVRLSSRGLLLYDSIASEIIGGD